MLKAMVPLLMLCPHGGVCCLGNHADCHKAMLRAAKGFRSVLSVSLAGLKPMAEVGTSRQEAQKLTTQVQRLLISVCTPLSGHTIVIRSHVGSSNS